jgi:hypothetical protein
VPKKGKDLYRDIVDGLEGNRSIADLGSRLFTLAAARDLAPVLSLRSIVHGFDIIDGYHIAPLTGCTGKLVLGFVIVTVLSVYDWDSDFEPPVELGADGSFQSIPGPHGLQVRFQLGWRLHTGC